MGMLTSSAEHFNNVLFKINGYTIILWKNVLSYDFNAMLNPKIAREFR